MIIRKGRERVTDHHQSHHADVPSWNLLKWEVRIWLMIHVAWCMQMILWCFYATNPLTKSNKIQELNSGKGEKHLETFGVFNKKFLFFKIKSIERRWGVCVLWIEYSWRWWWCLERGEKQQIEFWFISFGLFSLRFKTPEFTNRKEERQTDLSHPVETLKKMYKVFSWIKQTLEWIIYYKFSPTVTNAFKFSRNTTTPEDVMEFWRTREPGTDTSHYSLNSCSCFDSFY